MEILTTAAATLAATFLARSVTEYVKVRAEKRNNKEKEVVFVVNDGNAHRKIIVSRHASAQEIETALGIMDKNIQMSVSNGKRVTRQPFVRTNRQPGGEPNRIVQTTPDQQK